MEHIDNQTTAEETGSEAEAAEAGPVAKDLAATAARKAKELQDADHAAMRKPGANRRTRLFGNFQE